MRQTRAIWVAAALLLVAAAAGRAADEKETAAKQAAQKAAETWLAGVDKGDYAESWDQAAASFRQAVTREKWVSALKQVRQPLGAVKSRALKSATYATELPGAPKGEYVILQFDTTFENRGAATETVTPTLDGGQWRVSGYFIR